MDHKAGVGAIASGPLDWGRLSHRVPPVPLHEATTATAAPDRAPAPDKAALARSIGTVKHVRCAGGPPDSACSRPMQRDRVRLTAILSTTDAARGGSGRVMQSHAVVLSRHPDGATGNRHPGDVTSRERCHALPLEHGRDDDGAGAVGVVEGATDPGCPVRTRLAFACSGTGGCVLTGVWGPLAAGAESQRDSGARPPGSGTAAPLLDDQKSAPG